MIVFLKMAAVKKLTIGNTILNVSFLLLGIAISILYKLIKKCLGLDFDAADVDKNKTSTIYERILRSKDITEIAEIYGYIVREHVITTEDEYVLVIHKLEKRGIRSIPHGKIAYFHHGLLTNSELFLLGGTKDRILPFLLVDMGYDVWLGNNRGNKYSMKHTKLSIDDSKFWDFSLDEYALYDIPNSIDYILSHYKPSDKITYIGFSQGCSQLFASLSLKPELNSKLNLFVGLSPAIIPRNLNHPVFKAIVVQSANNNEFLYSVFGNKAILPSVAFWSYFLGSALYEKVVDTSLVYLFGWTGKNLTKSQKIIGYPHMFSNSSVKSLVHWFQIINSKRFQMFDETCNIGMTKLSNLSSVSRSKSNRVAPFPISHHLNVPTLLVYGDSDILIDMENTKKLILDANDRMKNNLIDIVNCPGYEHMDTLWGKDVVDDVFMKVIDTMESLTHESKISGVKVTLKTLDVSSCESL